VSVLRAYRALLSNRPLVRLLAGEFISSIGDWLYLVALLIVVYQVSSDPLLLGLVGAARILPYVVLSIPAGIIADRFDRRLVLLVTDVARGAIMLAMAGLVEARGPLAAIVGLAILATCFSCFFGPTIGAYLPSLVHDEDELGPANSAWSTLDNLAFVIGPAVAGLLIAASGLTLAFLLNAVSFAVVAVVLWLLPSEAAARPNLVAPDAPVDARGREVVAPGSVTDVPAGRPDLVPLAGLALIDTVAGFVFGGLGVLTVVLAVDRLGSGEAGTGYLNAAVGVGGLVGAVVSGAFVVRSSLRLPLLVGSIGLAAGVGALGSATSMGPAMAAMSLAAAGSLLTEVVSTTIFQRIVPDAIRGRALGTIATISTLAYAAGSLVLPVAAGRVGIEPVLLGSGAAVLAGAAIATLLIGSGGDRGPSAAIVSAAALVADLPVFAGVPAARLAAAFARATEVATAPGTVVIREGDVADRFYVILDGTFDVDQAEAGRPAPRRLRTMGPGEVFGELGLLTGAPRSASVTAAGRGRLLALPAAEFLELVSSGPEIGPRLLALHRGGTTPG
jgi:Major Facilitator Superfamily/Cyclic nucleotide-binding domain